MIIVFGDDEYFYKWNKSKRIFDKIHTNLNRPVISATTYDNIIYGWVEDNKVTLVKLVDNKWETVGFK